ncbi:NUDIX domain-containing protein [Leuconostoc gelidum subsp. aenigmaticum]|uniref:NUDIX hydrolase n=1 Tax=Leuconostoc gelidum TaxID=1244 RepID=UPI001C7E19A6|nr:NUDIX domain-containing protein [Leuconostoc gelidum]MBZ6003649.1 NUDIX domain-containing protein [Leuconostoc gelidum subsp. aenigmaticum]MBZ6010227.1 NUDIX domain-containing protein [Leuconostoc gelidum subsp. aenigmaticum]MBZ6014412.1 NUDIX domain-containing protein [Leuconostoc gelidum subsp. gelidum]
MLNNDHRADKTGELWDVYDENNKLTGRTHYRGDKLNVGDYHLVVNALIFNVQGSVLLQQRSFQKITYPGMWTTATGGSALTGETSELAIIRELHEELNLTVTRNQLQFVKKCRYVDWIEDWYAIYVDESLSNMVRQESEVEAIRWATLSEAVQMSHNNDLDDCMLIQAKTKLFDSGNYQLHT